MVVSSLIIREYLKEMIYIKKIKEGSVRKRADGSWEGRYYINGNRYSVYAPNKVECVEKLNSAVKNKDSIAKETRQNKHFILNEWFDNWIKTYKAPNIKPQSLFGITSKYNKYIRESLGKRKINTITPLDWQKLFNNINYPSTARKLFTYMKSCYEKAMVNKVITDNPMLGVDLNFNHRTKEKFVPTKEQLNELLSCLYERRKELALVSEFISLTGLRVGEACALSIEDIDFDNKVIFINKSYNRYLKAITDPKTSNSIRTIPLFSRAEDIIAEYIDLYGQKETIFHKISSNNITNALKYYAKKCGLEGITPHSLRHYFSTICREADVDEKVVQKWMGHSSILMTLDTYTHVKEDFNRIETRKLDSFLSMS